MKRKIAILLVTIVLAISLLPVSVIAKGSYTEGYFNYEFGDGCITITGYFGKDEEAVVPDNIAGYPVSVIAEGAFVGTNAKKVYLPATIMEIEMGAIAEGINVFYRSTPDNTKGTTEPRDSNTEPQGSNTEPQGSNTEPQGSKTEPKGNDFTGNNSVGTNNNTAKNDTDSYQPLVQPERDENGNVAEGVNEGEKKIYVDEDGKLIEDPEEIKAIDAAQEAARQEKQPTDQTVPASESAGTDGWLIAGISFAVIVVAGITFLIIRRTKNK